MRRHPALALHQAKGTGCYIWTLRNPGRTPEHYQLDPVIVASDPALILDAARAGQGLMLAMDMSMEPDVKAGRLRRVLPDWMGLPQDLNALFPKERAPSPKVQAFVRYLQEQLSFTDRRA
ncbi:LysR substrate-binding domain-containing protein [Burkholderia sp. AU6039]|uniref:LysR substrate-binding domain-containing protein n=1 Tax=Burkholderia sp. AU6039 TaxID=2015344 RepID=UPI00211B073B